MVVFQSTIIPAETGVVLCVSRCRFFRVSFLMFHHQVSASHSPFEPCLLSKVLFRHKEPEAYQQANRNKSSRFLGKVAVGDVFLMLVPETLDLHVEILYFTKKAEKCAFHNISWNLSYPVSDYGYEYLRKISKDQRRMQFYAPQSKAYGTVRIINRTVKIVYISDVLSCVSV